MRTWTRWGVALATSAALTAVAGGAWAQKVAGDWHGTITFGPTTTPIEVTLKAKAGGGYEGSWTDPNKTVPLTEAKLDKGSLSFSNGSGNYLGHWDEAKKAWVGQWTPKMTMTFVPAPGGSAPIAPPPGAFPTIPTIQLVLTAGKP